LHYDYSGWKYSRLWRSDGNSISSNNIHALAGMVQPVMLLSYSVYLVVWELVGITIAVLVGSWRKF
jgi:hypothetical protein